MAINRGHRRKYFGITKEISFQELTATLDLSDIQYYDGYRPKAISTMNRAIKVGKPLYCTGSYSEKTVYICLPKTGVVWKLSFGEQQDDSTSLVELYRYEWDIHGLINKLEIYKSSITFEKEIQDSLSILNEDIEKELY